MRAYNIIYRYIIYIILIQWGNVLPYSGTTELSSIPIFLTLPFKKKTPKNINISIH